MWQFYVFHSNIWELRGIKESHSPREIILMAYKGFLTKHQATLEMDQSMWIKSIDFVAAF